MTLSASCCVSKIWELVTSSSCCHNKITVRLGCSKAMSATAPTQRASSDALLSLPEDLVGRILFSGYLPISWWWTVNLILVCKKFKELGNVYIASVVNKERFVFDPFTQKPVFLGVLDIDKYAKNLVYLDLSFCADLDFTNPALVEMVLGLKTTLRSLSLRGARSCNEFLVSTVPHLEHLRYLNLSQTLVVDKGLITDFGALQLVKLKNLRWLNLSMTLITDVTIVELQRNCPFIEHLDLFGCSDLTDRSLEVICKWKLQVLDISACTKLTYKGFEKFCSPR